MAMYRVKYGNGSRLLFFLTSEPISFWGHLRFCNKKLAPLRTGTEKSIWKKGNWHTVFILDLAGYCLKCFKFSLLQNSKKTPKPQQLKKKHKNPKTHGGFLLEIKHRRE